MMIYAMSLAMAQTCPDATSPYTCAQGVVPSRTTDVMGISSQGTWWSYPGHNSWTHGTNTVDPEYRIWKYLDGDADEWGCGISIEDEIECWGNSDAYSRLTDRPSTGAFTHLDVAYYDFACALDTSGVVHCWGRDSSNQVTNAPTATGHTDVAVGSHGACAITSTGSLECWGSDSKNLVTGCDGLTGPFTSVDVFQYGAVAVKTDGSVELCGDTTWPTWSEWVANAPSGTDVVEVAVNDYGTNVFIAWHTDGTITLWQHDGSISNGLTRRPGATGGASRSVRTNAEFKALPQSTASNICGIIETDPDGNFGDGDAICWGQIQSGGGPMVIGTCSP